jgi:HK97 family phage portal protein
MKIFGYTIEKRKAVTLGEAVRQFSGSSSSVTTAENLPAVYRCVSVIAQSVASLPLYLYEVNGEAMYKLTATDNELAGVLNDWPDGRMTRYNFLAALTTSMLLRGNGYAWIDRRGDVPQLVFLHPDRVKPVEFTDEFGNPRLQYSVKGFDRYLEADELIHVLNGGQSGLVGVSTLTYAAHTLGIAIGAEQQAKRFFEGAGQPSGILTVNGRMDEETRRKNYNIWEQRLADKPGGVMILEGPTMNYQPISVSPADAQLLESREFSVIDICRFFGVSPVKCFDLTKSSYSTVEATQLSFLTDTLQPILVNIEQELKRKLFIGSGRNRYAVKFGTEELLRADKSSQASYFAQLVQLGILTPNEARIQMDLQPMAGGNKLYMQGAMMPVERINNTTTE